MSDIRWIKITVNIFDDEKIKLIDSMPDRDTLIVIWFKLLAIAGKTNDNGNIYIIKEIPTTDEMLATIFNRPVNTVRLALGTLKLFNMIEIKDHISIVNWNKHQNIDGLEKIRLQNYERQKRFRENSKENSNATVTLHNDAELDKNRIDIDKENNNTLCEKNENEEQNLNQTRIEEKETECKTSPNEQKHSKFQFILDLWNNTCVECQKVLKSTKLRDSHISQRIKNNIDLSLVFKKVSESSFLCNRYGFNKNNWKASFDWVISSENNCIKIIEGNFDNKTNSSDSFIDLPF